MTDAAQIAGIIHDVCENDDDSGGGAYIRAAHAIMPIIAAKDAEIERLRETLGGVTQLDASLRSLLKGEFSSLSISINDHACNYMTVAQWDDADEFGQNWVSDDERDKAREANAAWSVQWYPETPVGFHCVFASTLEAAVAGAIALNQGDTPN